MARKRTRFKSRDFSTFNTILNSIDQGNSYYHHYNMYLTMLAFQLYEWEGLPPSIDPSYLERCLTSRGHIAMYKDDELGFLVTRGAMGGQLDHYELATEYTATAPNFNKRFKLYNYSDMLEEAKAVNAGVLIKNNDLLASSLPSLEMFAEDLAEIKEIIRVNQNAQKTPNLIFANDSTLLTWKNVMQKVDSNEQYIFVNENLDLNGIKSIPNQAPYVVDKLTIQKDSVWNEVMTFMGIGNANINKKARVQSAEVESNDDQINSSGNIGLKARQEACIRMNELWGLNISVKMREELDLSLIENELGGDDDERNNSVKKDYRTTKPVQPRPLKYT